MGFTFKQFHINDDQCGMKVSTDSVLLGSWAELSEGESVLDIGTGSGLLALMVAQRGAASVLALELDASAFQQANENVSASPWSNQVEVVHASLEEFSQLSTAQYDHVISNPPYFEAGLISPCQKRGTARHGMNFEQLFSHACKLIKPEGKFSLVLPVQAWPSAEQACSKYQLHPVRITEVTTRLNKPAKLMLIELSPVRSPCQIESLLIHSETGEYSTSFKRLTADFYLNG